MGMNEDEGVGYLAEGALHDLISVLKKESRGLTICVEAVSYTHLPLPTNREV